MEKLIRMMYAVLIGMLTFSTASCGKDEPDNPDKDPVTVNPTTPVADPSNTISVNLLVGGEQTHLGEDVNVYIDQAYNLCAGNYTQIIDIGEVAGLGNITAIPEDGWKSKAAVEIGHGYVLKSHTGWGGTQHARLYVSSIMESTMGGIMGYGVKYQCPMNTPIKLDNYSVTLSSDGLSTSGEGVIVKILSGTNIEVKSHPAWVEVDVRTSEIAITADKNLTSKQRLGTVVISNSEGEKEISVTQTGNSEDIFAGGSGTEEDPYLVATAKQLDNVRQSPSSCFLQISDIDLSSYIDSEGNGWEPISDFKGVYDGNFKTISGLWINRRNTSNIGLFGSATNATFKHIMLELTENGIEGKENVAGICGFLSGSDSSVSQCSVEGNISGSNYVSGIVSCYTPNIKVSECRLLGNLNLYSGYVNYLCGISYNGNVSDCYIVGDLVSVSDAFVYAFSENSSNCYVVGKSIATAYYAFYSPNISNHCYGFGNVSDEQMKLKATYEGWNFNDVWSIEEGKDYPKLRCFK